MWNRRLIRVGSAPPIRACPLSWRDLYASGSFFQRELTNSSDLRTLAHDRGWPFAGLGREPWEKRDAAGTLRPIAFALAPYFSGMTSPAIPVEEITFREACDEFTPWDEFAVEIFGDSTVVERYSPWQTLMFDAVFAGNAPAAESDLHAAWEPALKVLVRLQNRYWPDAKGTMNMLYDAEGRLYDPVARDGFDARRVADELALQPEDAAGAYHFFAREAFAREAEDGLFLVRQMLPRRRRQAFKGMARRAQDFYDAAEVMRRFYADLTGEVLPDAEAVALADGNDGELRDLARQRNDFFGHEPRLRHDAEDARTLLGAAGLYPFGVHVVVEGESEQLIVEHLLREILGSALARDASVTSLKGVGGITKAKALMSALADYVGSSVLIIDREGQVEKVIERLTRDGDIEPADVLVLAKNLEESNFTSEELVRVAVEIAATANDKRGGAILNLTAEELDSAHAKRVTASPGKPPGKAAVLEHLTRNPEHGPAPVSKVELARGLASLLLDKLDLAADDAARAALYAERPVLGHIMARVVEPLNAAPWDRPLR
ncbi:MAG: hypothetical protein JWO74_2782 [Solirubrobacterales bacterium]|nr:hypothetical protein [Solirubrobacterales bacterium]